MAFNLLTARRLQRHISPLRPASTRTGHVTRREVLVRGTAALASSLLAPVLTVSEAGATGRWWSSLVWGVFENRPFDRVADLLAHRRLAQEGAVLAQYFAVAHPSGPNYRAMVSGEMWGDSETVDTFHPSVGSVLAGSVPVYLYHLAGRIQDWENPFVDLHAPVAATRSGLDTFATDLNSGTVPEQCLVYVGWGDDDNTHNGDLPRGDRNLSALLDVLGNSRWFRTPDSGGRYPALFFCYDEDDYSGNNRVFACWWGRGVKAGFISQTRHTHYGFCRTLTDNWGVPPLGHAADEGPINEVWS